MNEFGFDIGKIDYTYKTSTTFDPDKASYNKKEIVPFDPKDLQPFDVQEYAKYVVKTYNDILLTVNSYGVDIDDIPKDLIYYVILYEHGDLKLIRDICTIGIAIPYPEYNKTTGWLLND